MMMFQENTPEDVGPVRSSRYYYIAWAAEWRAAYVHAGGSPQALATLRAQGHGQLVFDANQFYNGAYFRRITTKAPPHNLYTTGRQLRQLATKVGRHEGAGGAGLEVRPGRAARAAPGRRVDRDGLLLQPHRLQVRPGHQHVQALRDRLRQAADGPEHEGRDRARRTWS